MWYKIDRLGFSIGVGARGVGGEWLSISQYGYALLTIGVFAWLAVKLPVFIILAGVMVIMVSNFNSK
jgi:apolipoprotein N-acyltransferase